MDKASPSSAEKPSPVKIRVKYDDLTAKYANQVLINGSLEEVYLDFSSGTMTDPVANESVLTIHTRIAMSPAAAARLCQTLQQTLQRLSAGANTPAAGGGHNRSAALPRLGGQ